MSTGGAPRPAARSHRWTVDRREGEWFVLEDEQGRVFDLPASLFPAGTEEGDVLVVSASGSATDQERAWLVKLDRDASAAARRTAAELLARLRGRDQGGDLEL